MINNRRVIISFVILALGLISLPSLASAESVTHKIDPLNYFDAIINATGNVTFTTDSKSGNFTISAASGLAITNFTDNFCDGQRNITSPNDGRYSIISCTLNNGQSAVYKIHDATAATRSELSRFEINMTSNVSGLSTVNVTVVRANHSKIMDTLVELGRGRGNYIFSTRYGGAKTERDGTTFFPANTTTQLYFLHRIYNIGQYLRLNEKASSIEIDCFYPGKTLVVYHMANATTLGSTNWTINYSFGEIEPSFWRMPYAGFEINQSDYAPADTTDISCKELNYSLSTGVVRVNISQNFRLTAGNVTPFNVIVYYPGATVINAGQTELEFTFEIQNANGGGNYIVDNFVFEADAPQRAKWIGTRGEIFGDALDKYTQRVSRLDKGESINLTLYARFDVPTTVSNGSALHSGNWSIKFIPPWDK